MNMATSIREVADVTIVDISGRIVLGNESAAPRDLVRRLVCLGHKKILFTRRRGGRCQVLRHISEGSRITH